MRLIDADALLEDAAEVCEDYGGGYFEFGYSHKQIEEAPTVDAVEVVRCNQCKHYEGVHGVSGNAPCAFWGIGAVMWDDFCKRGEMWDE